MPPPESATNPSPPANAGRLASIDWVRGLVMVLMALDHVRVYSGQPAGGPTPGIFFTRWVTNLAAPAFVFLAGSGIFLSARRAGDVGKSSRQLLTRGVWLVLIDLTVMRLSWTFNLDFAHYNVANVIWMIGWCMILMAGLIRLPVMVNAVGGVALIALHNLTAYTPGFMKTLETAPGSWLWNILYLGDAFHLGENGPPVFVLYVIVPWIGVMMAGYAFGQIVLLPPERRRAICLRLGLALLLAFVALRALDGYGDPQHWHNPNAKAPALLRFLATAKYPPSLLFLLMTLGPTILFLAIAENARSKLSQVLVTFGRVPFFFYVLHIPLIHLTACAISLVREGAVNPWLFANHPLNPGPAPVGYMWSLPLLYTVTVLVVAALYFPCRRFARLKAESKSTWLSYL